MQRVLITGSQGHVGGHLLHHLRLREDKEVYALDRAHDIDEHAFTMGFAPPGNYFRCDISQFRQIERVISRVRPDIVFNAAAEFGRWNGEDYYENLWNTNVVGFRHILRLQEEYGFRLVHFSSSEVYGDYDGVMSEDIPDQHPITLLNDYAITKRVNELQIRNGPLRDRSAVIRLFNVYGPGERYSPYRSFVCRLLYSCLHRLPFAVFRGHSRVHTYITDVVDAIGVLADLPDSAFHGIYNIAGDDEADNVDVVRLALREANVSDDGFIRYCSAEPRTTRHKHVDARVAREVLGLQTRVGLEAGIRETCQWMRRTYSPAIRGDLTTTFPSETRAERAGLVAGGCYEGHGCMRREAELREGGPHHVRAIATGMPAGTGAYGQHNDDAMSKTFFRQLCIPDPVVRLEIGRASPAACTARILAGLEDYIEQSKPAWVVVVGDVTSTLACALLARMKNRRVAHVEAGLRSFDDTMLEETNRRVTDAVSDLLLASETEAVINLRDEGVRQDKIRLVGNVMIDTLRNTEHEWRRSDVLNRCALTENSYHVLTLHRPSNVDDPTTLASIVKGMQAVARDIPVVLPCHPRTERNLKQFGIELGAIKVLPALPYFDFIKLVASSAAVWTDSGGLQEESCALDVPCFTLRTTTERPSTLKAGGNVLVKPCREDIVAAYLRFQGERHQRIALPTGWDGHAAERVVDSLLAA